MRLLAAALVAGFGSAALSCGGSSGPTQSSGGGAPTPSPTPAGPRSQTVSGTVSLTQIGGAVGCSSGNGHAFEAGEGTVTVTVVAASGDVAAQICHPTAVNHATDCTIPPFAPIAVGASVSAALKGGRQQLLKFVPAACNDPAFAAPSGPVTYTATFTYPG
jgi:hypothetical protein